MTWLRKNWFGLAILIFIIGFAIYWFADEGADNKILKRTEKENKETYKTVNEKERENAQLREEALKHLEDAAEHEKKKNEILNDLALERMENARLKEKIKTMPANEVVAKSKEILETEEIYIKPDGILFSLVAARKNLEYLEGFTLAPRVQSQIDKLEAALKKKEDSTEAMGKSLGKLNLANVSLASANLGLKDIIKNKDIDIDVHKKGKKKAYKKGLITGVIVIVVTAFVYKAVRGK